MSSPLPATVCCAAVRPTLIISCCPAAAFSFASNTPSSTTCHPTPLLPHLLRRRSLQPTNPTVAFAILCRTVRRTTVRANSLTTSAAETCSAAQNFVSGHTSPPTADSQSDECTESRGCAWPWPRPLKVGKGKLPTVYCEVNGRPQCTRGDDSAEPLTVHFAAASQSAAVQQRQWSDSALRRGSAPLRTV